MTWQEKSIFNTQINQGLADAITTSANTIDSALGATETALTAVENFITEEVNPTATAVHTLQQQVSELVNDFFNAGYSYLFLHPWQYRVGKGTGIEINLTFPSMIQKLVQKLQDRNDKNTPTFSSETEVSALIFAIGSPSLANFQRSIQYFKNLLQINDFEIVLRRIEQAFELEQNKYKVYKSKINPPWKSYKINQIGWVKDQQDAFNAFNQQLSGYTKGTTKSIALIKNLVAKKKRQIASLKTAFESDSKSAEIGAVQAGKLFILDAKANGTTALAQSIANANKAPTRALTLCASASFVAPTEIIQPLINVVEA